LSQVSQGGQAITQDGVLSYFTAAYFPSFGPVNDIAFGFGAPGIIGYSVGPGFNFGSGTYVIQSSVPEPPTVVLLATAFILVTFQGAKKRESLNSKRRCLLLGVGAIK
jgi:hypothetical protein